MRNPRTWIGLGMAALVLLASTAAAAPHSLRAPTSLVHHPAAPLRPVAPNIFTNQAVLAQLAAQQRLIHAELRDPFLTTQQRMMLDQQRNMVLAQMVALRQNTINALNSNPLLVAQLNEERFLNRLFRPYPVGNYPYAYTPSLSTSFMPAAYPTASYAAPTAILGSGGYGFPSMPMSYGDYPSLPSAYSYSDTDKFPASAAAPAQATVYIDVYDGYFQPARLTVSAGTTVRWTNRGGSRHTVTSDSFLWSPAVLAPGDSFGHTFSNPGTFSYHCDVHPEKMRAEVVVVR